MYWLWGLAGSTSNGNKTATTPKDGWAKGMGEYPSPNMDLGALMYDKIDHGVQSKGRNKPQDIGHFNGFLQFLL